MRQERVRETDYVENERPNTRLEQFFDIFKHRFVELLKLSLLQAVFNMPLIVSLILFYGLVRSATDINSLMTVFIIQGCSFIISVPVAFIGLTGSFYSIKKIAFAEGEYASSSFFIGLKEEWKNGLLIGLICGFSIALSVIGFFFFYFYLSSINATISGFGIAILFIQAIVVYIVTIYSVGQIVIYSNKLKYVLKNSFIMTLMRFPLNLLIFIIHPGIFVTLVLIMDITMYVGVVLLVFIVAVMHTMWMMNLLGAFDKYINKENHQEIYRKGLKIEEA